MTLDEFFEKLKAYEWREDRNECIRTRIRLRSYCPLQAVFGRSDGYAKRAKDAGLPDHLIMVAADGMPDLPVMGSFPVTMGIRRRMLELVKK